MSPSISSVSVKRVAALVLTSCLAGPAAGQSIPKEGRYDFNACWSGVSNTIEFSKTHTAMSYEMTGVARSNPPGGLFDKSTFRCVGTNSSFDGRVSAMTVCEGLDPDGDKRLSYFSQQGEKTVREYTAGTGKWNGIAITSSAIEPLGPFPTIKSGTFQNCNRQTGSYKMK